MLPWIGRATKRILRAVSGQRLCCIASIGVLLFAIASAAAQTTPAAQSILIRAEKLFDAESGR
jgi:hypothetical protein